MFCLRFARALRVCSCHRQLQSNPLRCFARALRVCSCHPQLQSDPLRCFAHRQPICFDASHRALHSFCRLVLSRRRSPTSRWSGRAARADVLPSLRSGSSGLELPPAAPKRPASLLRSGSSRLQLPPAAPKRPASLLRCFTASLSAHLRGACGHWARTERRLRARLTARGPAPERRVETRPSILNSGATESEHLGT